MRAFLIAVLLVISTTDTAEARRGGIVVIVSGDAIEHIRDLDGEQAAIVGYPKLGYHYNRFGLFWLDLWRSDGEFVVYDGNSYAPITADELAVLGDASVPWRYHLPPLLLILVAGLELLVVGRKKRKVKLGFYLGGAFAVIAVVFYFKGLTWEFLIPGFLAAYHALLSYWAMKEHVDEAPDAVAETKSGAHEAAISSSGAMRPVADTSGVHKTSSSGTHRPLTESGPIRSRPSQPIVIERPSQPVSVPTRIDETADAPKLLR